MNALDYIEQAAAHADEGPLGEPAARSILRIAKQFAEALEALEAMVKRHIKRGPFDEPLGESEQEDEINAAVRALAKARGVS